MPTRRLLATATLPVLLLLAACAGPGKNQRVCPESQYVRCLSGMSCQYDAERGCDMCNCDTPAYVPLDK